MRFVVDACRLPSEWGGLRPAIGARDFDGTIGQDFLSRFNVHIDYDARKVTLTER
jgi:hypothetical protein